MKENERMSRQYIVTELEMKCLLDRLELAELRRTNHIAHPSKTLTPDEQNLLNGVHRSFHMVAVQWANEIGFTKVYER
jgi:hypothetical protein